MIGPILSNVYIKNLPDKLAADRLLHVYAVRLIAPTTTSKFSNVLLAPAPDGQNIGNQILAPPKASPSPFAFHPILLLKPSRPIVHPIPRQLQRNTQLKTYARC